MLTKVKMVHSACSMQYLHDQNSHIRTLQWYFAVNLVNGKCMVSADEVLKFMLVSAKCFCLENLI